MHLACIVLYERTTMRERDSHTHIHVPNAECTKCICINIPIPYDLAKNENKKHSK